jgi:hypothetical protein
VVDLLLTARSTARHVASVKHQRGLLEQSGAVIVAASTAEQMLADCCPLASANDNRTSLDRPNAGAVVCGVGAR